MIEFLKLVAQLAIGLALAAAAVRWALQRYKSEKIWEKQLALYSDLLSAVFRLTDLLHRWTLHFDKTELLSEPEQAELRAQYEIQRQSIKDSAYVAAIIVPFDHARMIADIADNIETAFDRKLGDRKSLERELAVAETARGDIINVARLTLGTWELPAPKRRRMPSIVRSILLPAALLVAIVGAVVWLGGIRLIVVGPMSDMNNKPAMFLVSSAMNVPLIGSPHAVCRSMGKSRDDLCAKGVLATMLEGTSLLTTLPYSETLARMTGAPAN